MVCAAPRQCQGASSPMALEAYHDNKYIVGSIKPSIGEVINYIIARLSRLVELTTLIESSDRGEYTRLRLLDLTLYYLIE